MSYPIPPTLLATVIFSAMSGCMSPPHDGPGAHDGGGDAFELEVVDHADRRQHPDRVPRAPRLRIHTAEPLDAENEPVLLLLGPLDAALRDDLTRSPLLATHRPRVWPSALTFEADRVTLTPTRPLCAGCAYTLVIAGYARFAAGGYVSEERETTAFELSVSSDVRAGASVMASLPADGASGVPTNLRFAALVLDGEVRGFDDGLWLEAPDGTAVDALLDTVPCEELETTAAKCIVLQPQHPLRPLSTYALRTGPALRDAQGTSLSSFRAMFTTADTPDRWSPQLQLLPCDIDETPLPVGCALIDDTGFSLHVVGDDLARVTLQVEDRHIARLARRNEVRIDVRSLDPGHRVTGVLDTFDAANQRSTTLFAITTPSDLPKLSITEVRADPRGPEPAQEFVEITNYDTTPIQLAGFTLSDNRDEPGEALTTDAVVYPGARVLLVADAFDPDDTHDVPVPAGTTLVRVGKSLASSGLTNAGEPLFLRDPLGRRVSAAPASKAPRAGACSQRTSTDMRSGDASAFGYDGDGGCTPGK